MDYLAEEVFNRQPPAVQDFLLETSILGRFCAELCRAVTGVADSEALLAELYRLNLFLIPLDSQRRWYRYHHLFADLLRARLARREPSASAELHRRAARWLASEGLVPEAVTHAFAARDYALAADLVEAAWVPMMHAGEINLALGWLRDLPAEAFAGRPLLSLAFAWGLCLTGQFDAALPRLLAAEDAFAALQAQGRIPPGDELPRRLPCEAHLIRSFLARNRGDFAGAVEQARQAIPLAEKVNAILQGNAYTLLGHAYREMGQAAEAVAAYRAAIPFALEGGNHVAALGSYSAVARLSVLQGRLRQAEQICLEGLQEAQHRGIQKLPAAAVLHLALADLYIEWNRLDEAEASLQRAEEIGRYGGTLEYVRYHGVVLARLRVAREDLAGALAVLEEDLAAVTKLGAQQPLNELEARRAGLWARAGRLPEALAWAEAVAPALSGGGGSAREAQLLNYARVKSAAGETEAALDALETALEIAESDQRPGSRLLALLLRALARRERGSAQDAQGAQGAQADLRGALALAEPEGFTRTFLDEGGAALALLEEAGRADPSLTYVGHLLREAGRRPARPPAPPAGLAEPLTARELEVLGLIGAGLSNQQIADRLVLSLATVKKHASSVLGKLDVESRTQAVARARQLGLL